MISKTKHNNQELSDEDYQTDQQYEQDDWSSYNKLARS
jgi:hypothetical protein